MTTMPLDCVGIARTVVRTPVNSLLNLADPPVIVLTYHRVAALPVDPEMLAVTPDNFREQMRYLKESVSLVRFEDDWAQVPKPAVAVTFDDGYADNALQALPIIKEVGVPATFFVSTGLINTRREFWWHELERTLLSQQNLPASFSLNDGRGVRRWPTGTRDAREHCYREIVRTMNRADPEHRENWLAQLRAWAQCSNEPTDESHRAMTVDELRLLAESSWVTIGAHTVTHSRLSSLTAAAQQEEITASKRHLESWLGRKILVFSYPFGKRTDFTKETAALCRQAGFAKSAANFPGQAHRWTDPHRIPRMLVRNWPETVFAEKLRAFWTR